MLGCFFIEYVIKPIKEAMSESQIGDLVEVLSRCMSPDIGKWCLWYRKEEKYCCYVSFFLSETRRQFEAY
jgi:hypothetical protein